MGEQSEYFAAVSALDGHDRAERRRENLAALEAAAPLVRFTLAPGGETVLLREPGRPRVDFYPSTGRWRVVGEGKSRTQGGGAAALLAWYAKQGKEG